MMCCVNTRSRSYVYAAAYYSAACVPPVMYIVIYPAGQMTGTYLTHWAMWDATLILNTYFWIHVRDKYHEHFLWNYHRMNVTRPLMITLGQVMAWWRQATSHYLSQCWRAYLSPYGVTMVYWVKKLRSVQNDRYYVDDIFKYIFLNENGCILHHFSRII